MTDIAGALNQYRELSRRLDDKFSEIQSSYSEKFACRLGCHSCCKPALTVSRLEKESLQEYLKEKPELIEKLRALTRENPHNGKRCNFLSAEGACLVYEARPLVAAPTAPPSKYVHSAAKTKTYACAMYAHLILKMKISPNFRPKQ